MVKNHKNKIQIKVNKTLNMNKKSGFGLFISVVSVSFAAIFIETLLRRGMQPVSIAFYRLLFTVLFLLPILLFYKKYRTELLNINKKTFLLMLGIGIILSIHFYTWVTSLNYTSVASSVILVTAHPVLVAPVAYYFLKEKLSILNISGIIISLIGVAILVLGNYDLGPLTLDSIEGNILAIIGGICAGLYILGGRKVRKKVSVVSYAFVVYSIATFVLFFVFIFSQTDSYSIKIEDYGILILMAFVAGILGHTLYNWSLKYIRASVASVALLGEPIGSTLFAYMAPWISEIPSSYTFIGGAIILTGIYLTSRDK